MPGFDGVETLKRIREIDGGIYQERPVIALTANTISGAREMFRNEGFTEFIPKPIERTVLERVLRKVLPEQCIRYKGQETTLEKKPESAVPVSEEIIKPEIFVPEETETAVPASEETAESRTPASEETAETGSAVSAPEETMETESAVSAPGETMVTESAVPSPEETMATDTSACEEIPEPAEPDQTNDPSLLYAPLIQIGVNIQLGLDYCCGEHAFYMEMLTMFRTQAVEKRAELVSLYEAEDWNNYTVKVHALKSTALTIGAEQLADKARLLEQAGKNGNIGYIQHDNSALLRLYDEVCEAIAEL